MGVIRKIEEKELFGKQSSTEIIYPITSTKGVYEFNGISLYYTLPIRSINNLALYNDRVIPNKTFKEVIEAVPNTDRVNGYLLHYYNPNTKEWSLRRFKGGRDNLVNMSIYDVEDSDWNNENKWEEVISLGNIDDLEERIGIVENNITTINNNITGIQEDITEAQGDISDIQTELDSIKPFLGYCVEGEMIDVQGSTLHPKCVISGSTMTFKIQKDTKHIYIYNPAPCIGNVITNIKFDYSELNLSTEAEGTFYRGSFILELYYASVTTNYFPSVTIGDFSIGTYAFTNPYTNNEAETRVMFQVFYNITRSSSVGAWNYANMVVRKLYDASNIMEAGTGIKIEDKQISINLQQGEGINISGNTISSKKTDCLFEQAESVVKNGTLLNNINSLSMTLKEKAKALPNVLTVDFTNHYNVMVNTTAGANLLPYKVNEEEEDACSPTIRFYGSRLGVSTTYVINIPLNKWIPNSVIPYVKKVILASSPFWLAGKFSTGEYGIWKRGLEYFHFNRKATEIPEECSILVYDSSVKELSEYGYSVRLYDALIEPYSYSMRLGNYYYVKREEGFFDSDNTVAPYLMGKTLDDLLSYKTQYNIQNINTNLIGYIYSQSTVSPNIINIVDAFFGCFPYSCIEKVTLINGVIRIYMKTLSFYSSHDYTIPVPKLRIFIPKNEIINSIPE